MGGTEAADSYGFAVNDLETRMRLMHNVVPPAAIRHSTARYAACTDLQSGLAEVFSENELA